MKILLALLLCAFSAFIFSSDAHAVDAMELRVSRVGDVRMSCGQLSQEAVLMRDIVATTEDIQDERTLKGHGITAAGAVGSFIVGTATGGAGLAAAGFLLNHFNEEEAEKAGGVQDIAEQRRALMMGIYNAKGCHGPLDHAMQDDINSLENAHIRIAAVEPAAGEKEKRSPEQKPSYND